MSACRALAPGRLCLLPLSLLAVSASRSARRMKHLARLHLWPNTCPAWESRGRPTGGRRPGAERLPGGSWQKQKPRSGAAGKGEGRFSRGLRCRQVAEEPGESFRMRGRCCLDVQLGRTGPGEAPPPGAAHCKKDSGQACAARRPHPALACLMVRRTGAGCALCALGKGCGKSLSVLFWEFPLRRGDCSLHSVQSLKKPM